MSLPAIQTQPFLGFRLVAERQNDFVECVIEHAARRREPLTIGYLNAAQINLAYDDTDQARRLAALDWLYADGQSIVWASRRLGAPVPERVNAGDLTRELIVGLAERGLRLALVGGRSGEAEDAARRFCGWAPGLEIVLTHDGFFTDTEAPRLLDAIEAADPDLVWLGMGAPKQEHWALEWAKRAAARPRVWWCVGALFEYYAARRRRAPVWMRRLGLEWAFRLALEPRRLWKRYLLGNPLFVGRVLRGRPPRR